jgi:hypothetical protein
MGEGERVSFARRLHRERTSDFSFASDFGGIFTELLPGNFAKLQPPDKQDLMDGLEIKVQLGSVWKQSLTELSGGQRYVCPPHLPSILIVSPHSHVNEKKGRS